MSLLVLGLGSASAVLIIEVMVFIVSEVRIWVLQSDDQEEENVSNCTRLDIHPNDYITIVELD